MRPEQPRQQRQADQDAKHRYRRGQRAGNRCELRPNKAGRHAGCRRDHVSQSRDDKRRRQTDHEAQHG